MAEAQARELTRLHTEAQGANLTRAAAVVSAELVDSEPVVAAVINTKHWQQVGRFSQMFDDEEEVAGGGAGAGGYPSAADDSFSSSFSSMGDDSP